MEAFCEEFESEELQDGNEKQENVSQENLLECEKSGNENALQHLVYITSKNAIEEKIKTDISCDYLERKLQEVRNGNAILLKNITVLREELETLKLAEIKQAMDYQKLQKRNDQIVNILSVFKENAKMSCTHEGKLRQEISNLNQTFADLRETNLKSLLGLQSLIAQNSEQLANLEGKHKTQIEFCENSLNDKNMRLLNISACVKDLQSKLMEINTKINDDNEEIASSKQSVSNYNAKLNANISLSITLLEETEKIKKSLDNESTKINEVLENLKIGFSNANARFAEIKNNLTERQGIYDQLCAERSVHDQRLNKLRTIEDDNRKAFTARENEFIERKNATLDNEDKMKTDIAVKHAWCGERLNTLEVIQLDKNFLEEKINEKTVTVEKLEKKLTTQYATTKGSKDRRLEINRECDKLLAAIGQKNAELEILEQTRLKLETFYKEKVAKGNKETGDFLQDLSDLQNELNKMESDSEEQINTLKESIEASNEANKYAENASEDEFAIKRNRLEFESKELKFSVDDLNEKKRSLEELISGQRQANATLYNKYKKLQQDSEELSKMAEKLKTIKPVGILKSLDNATTSAGSSKSVTFGKAVSYDNVSLSSNDSFMVDLFHKNDTPNRSMSPPTRLNDN